MYLRDLYKAVEGKYKNLGRMVLVSVIASVARKPLLLVAPSGTGKSTVSDITASLIQPAIQLGSTTVVGLKDYAQELSGFRGVLIIDDVGGIDSSYARMATITSLCNLVTAGSIAKHSARVNLEIVDFQGAAVMNIQPIVLKWVIKSDQWDAMVQDRLLRYYHYFRPVAKSTDAEIDMPLPEISKEPLPVGKLSKEIQDDLEISVLSQWSRTRARLHTMDLLQATAKLNGHDEITEDDAKLLAYTLRPMRTERWLIKKDDFEGRRTLDDGLLNIMVEMATYGRVRNVDFEVDYKLSKSSVLELLQRYSRYIVPATKGRDVWLPSDIPVWRGTDVSLKTVMRDVGIEVRDETYTIPE